jgi:hypothetical protein
MLTTMKKNRKGLMEQIQDDQNKPKPKEELSKPRRRIDIRTIMIGLDLYEKLQKNNPEIFGKFKK